MKQLIASFFVSIILICNGLGQGAQPVVAVHDSELTRWLDSADAPSTGLTPDGAGTTGRQWWTTNWHYFVMPESVQEVLRSDGTVFTVVGDSNIASGLLLTNGAPRFPILISLATEAVGDDEIGPLTNYVAAGGFLLVGSSAFTRNVDGTSRDDFALGNEMGVHSAAPGLTNWTGNTYFQKQLDHRLVSHIPGGQLTWRMPTSSEEISWGTSPDHPFQGVHLIWQVQCSTATVLAQGDSSPYLTIQPYGKGYFIYWAAMQPLVGHGGFAPTVYTYVMLRRAIEWAFETMNLPVTKVSPWQYPYDAALVVRHDLENFTNEVAGIEASAQFEATNGAKGDYYFCTGALRDDAWPDFDTNSIVAGMRSAITNYGATIGSHNGGLKNPNNSSLVRGQYDYWHWGPDEAIDATPTNYVDGKSYAFVSVSNSFTDLEGWLSGVTNGLRAFTGCYFNATREDSYDIEEQLGVKISGDQKVGPFPAWTLSTRTDGKRYSFLSVPVSDWFVGGMVAQSLEPWHPPGVHTITTLHDAVDFYYNLGGLIGFYSHTLSTGLGGAGALAPEYVTYSMNTNLHPRLWAANAADVYGWWLARSNAQLTSSYAANGRQSIVTLAVAGGGDPSLAAEVLLPGSGAAYGLSVSTNWVTASGEAYRTNGQVIKVLVGVSVTNVQLSYVLGPLAVNDMYSIAVGSTLNVAAPGVLGNDGYGNSTNLMASVVIGPTNGVLMLDSNGGFSYTPAGTSIGFDMFTYAVIDELGNTSQAQVVINLLAPTALFEDNFTRPTEPGTLDPWIVESGDWTVSEGLLLGGTNQSQSYGSIYITNVWSDYAVSAQFALPTNAYGGGVEGRVNPATGARYGAWVYPEGSQGGSNLLKLVKFSNWTTYGYSNQTYLPMKEVSLPSVGTNFHEVKLAFQSNQIAIYFDGVQQISVADTEAQTYASGSVALDMWRESIPYQMGIDAVLVTPLVVDNSFVLNEDSPLIVPGPGVLTNDTAVFTTNLAAFVVTGPTNGTLSLATNGGFVYTPAPNAYGVDHFTYRAVDGSIDLGTATVTVMINAVNDPPYLPALPNVTVGELSTLTITNTATDVDLPPETLTYILLNPPTGAGIDTNGIITWTPSEAQGPGFYTLTTVVTDNGVPPLSATNSFNVTVLEVNSAPVLPVLLDVTVNELTALTVTNTATDTDIPANILSYQLINAPAGVAIDTNGIITWTPSEAQGPGSYTLTTVVTDNGLPPLSATNSFNVTVLEVNSAPVLPVLPNLTVNELTALTVTNTATDTDIPANILSYQLINAPTGVAIDTNGIITWTPSEAQGPGSYTLTTVVTDNGVPPLSATNSFNVTVLEVNSAPVLPVLPDVTVNELTALTVTNTATDTDIPANILSYQLINAPTGVAIDTNGIITWTPSEAQGPGSYTLTTVVTDNGVPPLSATNSFNVTVLEVNSAPVLPVLPDVTVNELTALTVTNAATDTDIPANILSYQLINAPAGVAIDTNGIITWTPSEAQGPGFYTLTTVVTDNGVPPLSATNSFNVTVLEVNSAPVLPVLPDLTVNELTALTVTNTATDTDIPANILSYQLINAPTGTAIDTNGIITWTPSEAQGPGFYTLTTVVTDNGVPPLSATNSFNVTVLEVNSAPVLPVLPDLTVNELTALTVTNTATDTDIPANILSYQLINAPTGVAIDTNGIITWTPSEAQGPGFYTLTTVVTDNGAPPLSATNSFNVTVLEVNSAPVLPVLPNLTVNELTALTVTNTATDTDIPANILSYQLINAPTGVAIDTNGIITWTPSEAQGPGFYTLTTVVTDNGVPPLSATNSFNVTVLEVNSAPVLPVLPDLTVNELTALTVTNTATDTDIPANILSYQLINAPTGTAIDTNGIITWTPSEAQGPGSYTLTTVVTDNGVPPLSATNSFNVTVLEVNSAPVLPVLPDVTVNELTALTVTNTATDTDIPANILSYQLINAPTGVAIDTNGIITWTPSEAQGPGSYTLTTVVTDNGVPPLSATNSFNVTVLEVNSAPVLPVLPNLTVNELTALTVTNTATDTDIPANILSYQLINAPTGVEIDTNGIITWTPSEAQGPGSYTLTTVVTDNGVPPLSATNSFNVTVLEVNSAPVLPPLPNVTIDELTTLTVTNTATDTDIPANILSYQLINAPTGVAIDTNGIITWTPSEAQGPGFYTLTTVVTDNGVPPLSATNSFNVTVLEVNSAPVLPVLPNLTVNELTALTVTNTATDTDIPANILSYQLINAPTGVAIDTNGVITWTPSEAQGPGFYTLTTVVTDNGVPPLSATNSFNVTVLEVNSAPVLPPLPNVTINELTTLTVTNTATDTDIPANILSYVLMTAPTGTTISSNGIITWTPTEAQGPGVYKITTVVTDNGVPPLSATNAFHVTVLEVNSAPVLPVLPNLTVNELTTMTVTNTATDTDIPANMLSYALVNAPVGANISTNGIITWTPSEGQGPGSYTLTTVVSDNGVPPLSATNRFDVTVLEVNSAPVLPVIPDYTISELTTLTVTNTATDTDLPANTLSYTLLHAPPGAQIDAQGVITWTPTAAEAGTTNLFITVVADDGQPPLSATNAFDVIVKPIPVPPRILSLTVSNQQAVISWSSVAGLTYQVQFKDSLQQANWTAIEPNVVASGSRSSLATSIGAGVQRVYRLEVLP